MIRDQFGKVPSSEDAVVVFDTALNYDSEHFEDTLGWKLRDFDRDKYAAAYEVNNGAGADWPMVAYEVLNLAPYSAVVAAFFMGERIEKSILAWKRLVTLLLSSIPKGGFTDANGAALLALEHLFKVTDSPSVQLVAYTWVDEEVMFFDEPDKAAAAFKVIENMDKIQPRDQQFGVGLHSAPTFLFKFQADNRLFLVAVRLREVKILGI